MSAFPWDVLITGASTLGASVGAVWLKSYYDNKAQGRLADQAAEAARSDRRREAYAGLVKTARLVLRAFRDVIAFTTDEFEDTAIRSTLTALETLPEDLNQTVAMVELLGSDAARSGAKDILDKARASQAVFVMIGRMGLYSKRAQPGKMPVLPTVLSDSDQATAQCDELSTAIDRFVETVRPSIT